RDPIKIIAQDIIKNNLSPEEINRIAYVLASSASTTLHKLGADYLITEAVKIPFVTEKANQIQARKCILREINGYDCSEFFYLEKVQERLNEYDITKPPSMQNLIDIIIMLCMRSADVKNLSINQYKPSHESWYNPNYSWYCIGYTKNKGERSIPDRFSFLLKDKDKNTNVAPLNQFLSRYKIISFILRKIGADYASRVHGGRNDSRYQYLRQLACRHKIGHALSVEHYGVMNDRPNTLAPKQKNSEIVKAKVGTQKVNCRLELGFLGPSMYSDKLFKKIGGKISRKLTPEEKDSKFVREETTALFGLAVILLTFTSNVINNHRLSNYESITILTKVLVEKYDPKMPNYILLGKNWFYERNNSGLQIYLPEIVTDAKNAFVRTTLHIKDLSQKVGTTKAKKKPRINISVNKSDIHDFYKILPGKSKDSLYRRSNISTTSDSATSDLNTSDSNSGNSSTSSSEMEVIYMHKTKAIRKHPILKYKVK
ncbi:25330_t:CDS:2, partial [Gigaspora margarita]